jgi:imidazolonepropionase-like amidohydrolase
MSLAGDPGAQHYSDEVLRAFVDKAHRRGVRVAAHCLCAEAVKHAVAAGIDCIEHGFLVDDEAIELTVEHGTLLVATQRLVDGIDVSNATPELQAKAATIFPQARKAFLRAHEGGVKIAVASDAPAIPHGKNADEIVTLVELGPAATCRAESRHRDRGRTDHRPRPWQTGRGVSR